jgi:hypothetical protein
MISLSFCTKAFILGAMKKNLLIVCLPFCLSGCVGVLFCGGTGYLDEDYPDIRTVPSREAAMESRGVHVGDENVVRLEDFQALEQARKCIKERDNALREQAFDSSEWEGSYHPR